MSKPEDFFGKARLAKKLKARIVIVDGHWLWTGEIDKDGYGVITPGGKAIGTHRVSAYVYLGLDLNNSALLALHKPPCIIRRCINPEHLYIGTHKDNMKDLKRKANFKCGHLKTYENSKPVHGLASGYFICRQCSVAKARIRREQQKSKQTEHKKTQQT